jgi:hypothetical protein
MSRTRPSVSLLQSALRCKVLALDSQSTTGTVPQHGLDLRHTTRSWDAESDDFHHSLFA